LTIIDFLIISAVRGIIKLEKLFITLVNYIETINNQSQTNKTNKTNNITSKNEKSEIPEIPEIPNNYSSSYEKLINQMPKPGETINPNIEKINQNLNLIESFINSNRKTISDEESSYLKKLRKKLNDKKLKIKEKT
jgi:hypothetical protein